MIRVRRLTSGIYLTDPIGADPALAGDGSRSGALKNWGGRPANGSGPVTLVSWTIGSNPGAIVFFTISPANVVRDIHTTSGLIGTGTTAVNLDCEAGDYLGMYAANASRQCDTQAQTGDEYFTNTVAGAPTIGATLARTTTVANRALTLRGVR